MRIWTVGIHVHKYHFLHCTSNQTKALHCSLLVTTVLRTSSPKSNRVPTIFQIIIQRASYILYDCLMSLFAIKIPLLSDKIPQNRILHVEHISHYTYFPRNGHKVLFIAYQLLKSGSCYINQSSPAFLQNKTACYPFVT